MAYKIKDFSHLLGIANLSDQLLKNHFSLYEGYVKNTNRLDETLVGLKKANKYDTPEYAELNRRFGWEFNGMRMHELYFENLTKDQKSLSPQSSFWHAVEKEFGTFDNWQKDFTSLSAIRGIGWVILYYDQKEKRLFNVWVNEHDTGHFVGAVPLIVMDVFEHAYMLDYGVKKADYIAAFMNLIAWKIVVNRFESVNKEEY